MATILHPINFSYVYKTSSFSYFAANNFGYMYKATSNSTLHVHKKVYTRCGRAVIITNHINPDRHPKSLVQLHICSSVLAYMY